MLVADACATRSIGALAGAGIPGKPVAARAALVLAALVVVACGSGGGAAPSTAAPASASEVAIAGYDGIAMEPFVSRDGRFLLFNNSNDPGTDTDLHFARRVDLPARARGRQTSMSTSILRASSSRLSVGTGFRIFAVATP